MRGIVETEKERKDGIRKWEENRGCWNLKENRGVIESWKRVSFSGEEIEGIGNLVGSFCFMGIKGGAVNFCFRGKKGAVISHPEQKEEECCGLGFLGHSIF